MHIRIVIGCLATLLILNSCQGDQEKVKTEIPGNAVSPESVNNPATASSQGNAEDMLPAFQFKEESFDFGSITDGESVSHDFKFTNAGKSDLLISSANGSCGCTVPEYPKEAIKPGKQGVIKVTFNSQDKVGMQHKTITIIANTIPNSKVLTIKGEVKAKKNKTNE